MDEPTPGSPRRPGPTRRRSRVLRPARRLFSAWRGSLRGRVITTTVVVGVFAVGGLGAVLAGQVRDGLFEDRRDQILADAAARTEEAQERFDSQVAANVQDVQDMVNDVVRSLQEESVGNVGVQIMRSPGATAPSDLLLPATDTALADLIEPELRQQVRAESFQQWQSVALPTTGDDATIPGIAVGSTVTLPIVGEHEIYFVYTLAAEAQTLEVLQQVLIIGAVGLLVLLVVMAWYLARQVLDPVQTAARTAGRLAEGHLTERIPVRGRDELAVLSAAFNDMAHSLQDQIERLAELSRMQQRFVSDVSHELRTPLATIRMASEVLHAQRDEFEPTQRRSVELLKMQVDQFEALLADLLEISRFDAGSAVLDVAALDVRQVVEHTVAAAEPLATDRGSAIRIHAPDSECTADIDRRRVERIVRNLLVNAIEHGEGEPIDVEVACNEVAVSVVVRDHGIGMAAPEAQHLFDRFWRADPSRTRTLGGTGLGLAISLEDARLHGGTLQAWGTPGAGACFRLTVPRRAGLELQEHPLPLAPPREQPALAPQHEPQDPAGPATVPDLAGRDVEVGR